ncbi:MAG: hypothetical protein Ta2B_02410 [Termitinemataceae bacterium]|nr:MAG: hypothetical protein Ta2B_02410 [Termitinemataceae bacterium]
MWYARFWDDGKKAYSIHRALGIEVGGKKERKGEAQAAATALMPSIGMCKDGIGLVKYLTDFWQADSTYFKEAELNKGRKLSACYSKASLAMIRTHIEPFFKTLSLKSLTASHLRDFKQWESERGVSNYRINRVLQVLRVPVRYAISYDDLAVDPFRSIKNAFYTKPEKGVLTQEEAIRLITDTPKNNKKRLAILLGMQCGMRVGEVRGLMWDDIDFEKNVINIKHNWQNLEGLKVPKCGSFGTVPLPSAVLNILNVLKTDKETGLIFSSYNTKENKPFSNSYFGRLFVDELEAIGISKSEQKERNITFHSLRHSFVSLNRIAGVNLFEVQALARHKSFQMTEGYSHARQVVDVSKCLAVYENFLKNNAPN